MGNTFPWQLPTEADRQKKRKMPTRRTFQANTESLNILSSGVRCWSWPSSNMAAIVCTLRGHVAGSIIGFFDSKQVDCDCQMITRIARTGFAFGQKPAVENWPVLEES